MSNGDLTRRDFIKTGVITGAAFFVSDKWSFAENADKAKTDVWVFKGPDKTKLMEACVKTIKENGGFGDAKKLTLKVNAGWERLPEEGANTHPDLVSAFVKGAKELGVKEVVIPEFPCDAPDSAWERNGILAAAKKSGATMIDLGANQHLFKPVKIPAGVTMKNAMVGEDFIKTDCLVNMPIAKHHGGSVLTMAMKNWMGAVQDRGFWHRNDLHQCIADFSTFIKPNWTIIDATRILMTNGPKGPGELKHPELLILSRDQVAADVYTSQLFVDNIEKVKHLALARDMKLGETDVNNMAVHKINVDA